MIKWTYRFLKMAKEVSEWSKDPSPKVGCVIARDKNFISLGYNGFAKGIKDSDERLKSRDIKLLLTIHAEENAILSGLKKGDDLENTTIYCTHPPCAKCASKIIHIGIKKIICIKPKENFGLRWWKDLELGKEIIKEAGIIYFEVELDD